MEALQQLSMPVNQPPVIPKFFHHLPIDIPHFPPLIKKDITPQSEAGLMVSEKDYWENYYEHPDFRYEWNNGILEVKSVGDFASFVQSEFFYSIIKEHIKTMRTAIIVGLDIGFKLVLPNKTSIRKPDLAVILNSNPVQIEPDDCTYKGCFDMCIEFLSDSDKKGLENDTVIKKNEYSMGGVKEYFILDRNKKETSFYRLNSKGTYQKIKPRNGIIESHVLPGFKFRVKDLYSQPPLEKLIKDAVYQPYVLKSYQEQSQKTEKERLRAEKERLRA
ncbi:MAG: Uma2 family endonuclease, partial [Candidatus Magnetomorum sp.]|nr:Uma2 family endonuclease [Candidatus Magnetomorum sp.]